MENKAIQAYSTYKRTTLLYDGDALMQRIKVHAPRFLHRHQSTELAKLEAEQTKALIALVGKEVIVHYHHTLFPTMPIPFIGKVVKYDPNTHILHLREETAPVFVREDGYDSGDNVDFTHTLIATYIGKVWIE